MNKLELFNNRPVRFRTKPKRFGFRYLGLCERNKDDIYNFLNCRARGSTLEAAVVALKTTIYTRSRLFCFVLNFVSVPSHMERVKIERTSRSHKLSAFSQCFV